MFLSQHICIKKYLNFTILTNLIHHNSGFVDQWIYIMIQIQYLLYNKYHDIIEDKAYINKFFSKKKKKKSRSET